MIFSNQIALPELRVSAEAAARLRQEVDKLPGWTLDEEQAQILGLLASGALYPLRGYMTRAEADSVARDGVLPGGHVWPVPVTLRVTPSFAKRVQPGEDIGLWRRGRVIAIVSVTDHWSANADAVQLGGRVKVLELPGSPENPAPNRLRALWAECGNRPVVASCEADLGSDARSGVLTIADATNPDACAHHLPLPRFLARAADRDRRILTAILARNLGATHLAAADAAGIEPVIAALGLAVTD